LPRLRSLLYLLSFILVSVSSRDNCRLLSIELPECIIRCVLADYYGLINDLLLRLQIDVFYSSISVVAAFLDQGFVKFPEELLIMSILEAFFYHIFWWGLFMPRKSCCFLNKLDPTGLKFWTCHTSRTSLRYLLIACLHSVL
jgi:hypothetical protein